MMEPITEHEARHIASEWHGGQASALYAFSSSGYLDSSTTWEAEKVVSECERRAADPEYAGRLDSDDPAELLDEARALLAYCEANQPMYYVCRACGHYWQAPEHPGRCENCRGGSLACEETEEDAEELSETIVSR